MKKSTKTNAIHRSIKPKSNTISSNRTQFYGNGISRAGLMFVLPAVLFFAVFSIFPIGFGFYLSLTDYNLISPPIWVGMENYINLFEDRLFIKALYNTIIFVLGATLPVWMISLGFALLFFAKFRGNSFLRVLAFSPVLPPLVVVAVVWKLLLHPAGIVTSVFTPFLDVSEINWLTDTFLAPMAMILVHDWTVIPFFMLIWLAGLSGVPKETQEAAIIDGASRLRILYEIILPQLKPTSVLVGSLATINAFQAFILQYVMSPDRGGPADSTLTLALLVWKYGFQYFRMGDAAAVSFVLFFFIVLITIVQLWLGRDKK